MQRAGIEIAVSGAGLDALVFPDRGYVAPVLAAGRQPEKVHGNELGQRFEDFGGEKSDLALVVVFVVEEAIAANPVAGHALDLLDFDERKVVRRATVVSEVVVAGRNENLPDDHSGD